jgi:putative transposase
MKGGTGDGRSGQDAGRGGRRKVLGDEDADVLRESLAWLARQLMEVEVSELIGAEGGERRPQDRAMHRNG